MGKAKQLEFIPIRATRRHARLLRRLAERLGESRSGVVRALIEAKATELGILEAMPETREAAQ